jgi:elongation factor P
MDQVSYEQILIKKSKIGEKGKLLKENTEVTINFYDDNPLSVDLPITINCKIIMTDASLKGQTVSSSYKPAIIENDVKIQVPPFIDTDDEILIDTRTLEYVKKIQ